MNLHEYHAKELLRKFNLPLLNGRAYVDSLETIEKDLDDLKGPPWVVKSQIHAGGRGAGYFKTSFNDKGEPMVCDPKDALVSFCKTNLEYLYLENFLIKRTQKNIKNIKKFLHLNK